MKCPYCKKEAIWCDNSIIYGRNIGVSHKIYYCKNCGASVGCHNNTRVPLGRMANAKLRQKRIDTHNVVDDYWRYGEYTRDEVYNKLKNYFGFSVHIGNCNIKMCDTIINNIKEILKAN